MTLMQPIVVADTGSNNYGGQSLSACGSCRTRRNESATCRRWKISATWKI